MTHAESMQMFLDRKPYSEVYAMVAELIKSKGDAAGPVLARVISELMDDASNHMHHQTIEYLNRFVD